MRILIYGAGTIGCIYALKLYQAGNELTLLARGKQYDRLKNGIVARDLSTNKLSIAKVPLTQKLTLSDHYDLIIVAVRFDQIGSVLPVIAKNMNCPLVMFLMNNPADVNKRQDELTNKKIILGFPGFGGTCHEERIDFLEIKGQKTTIGDIDGKNLKEVISIKQILNKAGFKTAVTSKMSDWLKVHALFITCLESLLLKENGSHHRRVCDKLEVKKMIRSVKEGMLAYRKVGIEILPANLKTIFLKMPEWFAIWYWQRTIHNKLGKFVLAPYAIVAQPELRLLAKNVLDIVHSSDVNTPILDRLLYELVCDRSNYDLPSASKFSIRKVS